MYLIPSYGSFIEEMDMNFPFIFVGYFFVPRMFPRNLEIEEILSIKIWALGGPSPLWFFASDQFFQSQIAGFKGAQSEALA